MTWLGWVANTLLCYQWWAIGKKYRHGLIIGVIAGIMWSVVAVKKSMEDLLFIEIVLSVLQFRAWLLWRKKDVPTDCSIHTGANSEQ